jgi:hypothetical protein
LLKLLADISQSSVAYICVLTNACSHACTWLTTGLLRARSAQWPYLDVPSGLLSPVLEAFAGAYAVRGNYSVLGFMVTLMACVGALVNGACVCLNTTSSISSPMTLFQVLMGPSGCGKVRAIAACARALSKFLHTPRLLGVCHPPAVFG